MALTCSNCGKELPDDAKFCSECGTTVAVQEKKPEYCANCFAELSENAKFCLQCGKPAVVAAAYVPPPKHDQAIRDELKVTSPGQVNYREYEVAHKAWEQTPLEYKEPERNFNDIVDFEKNKAEIAHRAMRWVEYKASGMERIHWFQALVDRGVRGAANDAWSEERSLFRTNKPNYHKALFYETFIDSYLWYGLHEPGAITFDDPPEPTLLFLDYLREVRGYTEEDIKEFELEMPDMKEIKQWPQKDDELFPPPQPVQVEAAGGIINFTTDEAVVIVYLDCVYKGKEVELRSVRDEELGVEWQKATVIERTYGNTPICVAIFKPIPFATDEMKYREKAVDRVKVVVSASWTDDKSNVSAEEVQKLTWDKVLSFSYREEAILFKGHVTQIDWRGRRGKAEMLFNR